MTLQDEDETIFLSGCGIPLFDLAQSLDHCRVCHTKE